MKKTIKLLVLLLLIPLSFFMLSDSISDFISSNPSLSYKYKDLKTSIHEYFFPPTKWETATKLIKEIPGFNKEVYISEKTSEEKKFYSEHIVQGPKDIMILPFQGLPYSNVDNRSMPVDSVARMLMARLLSSELESLYSLNIPNPDHIGRALGGKGNI